MELAWHLEESNRFGTDEFMAFLLVQRQFVESTTTSGLR